MRLDRLNRVGRAFPVENHDYIDTFQRQQNFRPILNSVYRPSGSFKFARRIVSVQCHH